MHRKLATCQCRSGRICIDSQRSSLGSQDDQRLRLCERQDNHSTLAREYAAGLLSVQKMSQVFAVRSIRQVSQQSAGSTSRSTSRFVRKLDRSPGFSCDHDNLSDYIDIATVTELLWTMELRGVGMDNQGAVLKAAASAQICAVTPEKDIQWLLPQWF